MRQNTEEADGNCVKLRIVPAENPPIVEEMEKRSLPPAPPLTILHVRPAGRVTHGLTPILNGIPAIEAVIDANDALDAWTALKTHRPDLLLMDWDLGDEAAPNLLRHIRDAYKDLWCVAIVGSLAERQLAYQMGAHVILWRGFGTDELAAVLEQYRQINAPSGAAQALDRKADTGNLSGSD